MNGTHEPARDAWPVGLRAHLEREFQGFSPLVSRAMDDNCASLFRDGPYTHVQGGGVWTKIRHVAHEFLWPR